MTTSAVAPGQQPYSPTLRSPQNPHACPLHALPAPKPPKPPHFRPDPHASCPPPPSQIDQPTVPELSITSQSTHQQQPPQFSRGSLTNSRTTLVHLTTPPTPKPGPPRQPNHSPSLKSPQITVQTTPVQTPAPPHPKNSRPRANHSPSTKSPQITVQTVPQIPVQTTPVQTPAPPHPQNSRPRANHSPSTKSPQITVQTTPVQTPLPTPKTPPTQPNKIPPNHSRQRQSNAPPNPPTKTYQKLKTALLDNHPKYWHNLHRVHRPEYGFCRHMAGQPPRQSERSTGRHPS